MKKIFIISVILSLVICCNDKASVTIKEKDEILFNFKIFFENGFFYNDKDTQKILIKFYDDEFLFIKDTSMGISIYIYGKKIDFDKSDFNNSTMFFVKAGGGSVFYGFMKPANLKIKYESGRKKTLIISGKFKSKNIFPTRHSTKKITFEFQDLKLSKVDSMKKIHDQSNEYFKEKVKEYMPDW